MIQTKCPDCGAIVGADRNVCPECGCPVIHETTPPSESSNTTTEEAHTVSPNTNSPIQPTPMPIPFFQADLAQYFYECGVIGWEAFKKYACFTGRASRREFWSFNLICWLVGGFTGGLAAFILLLPMIRSRHSSYARYRQVRVVVHLSDSLYFPFSQTLG